MYLLKSIYVDSKTNAVVAEDGILITKLERKKVVVSDEYWGRTEIHFGDSFDFSEIPAEDNKDTMYLLPYVHEYEVKDIGDGFKEIFFNVAKYTPERKKGYIVFINQGFDIETDGKIIFRRYSYEGIIELTEGQYIKLGEKVIKVIDNQLVTYI